MVNDKNLEKEVFEWKQRKLEQGTFPCKICRHLRTLHVKGECMGCSDDVGSFSFHQFKQMDNLSIIEWMSQHKEGVE